MTRLGTSHSDWKKEAGQIYLSSSARAETTKLEKSGLLIFYKTLNKSVPFSVPFSQSPFLTAGSERE
jgi:hypothetical protein